MSYMLFYIAMNLGTFARIVSFGLRTRTTSPIHRSAPNH